MSTTSRVAVGDWPRLSRFYGLSPFELARLPRWLTEFYAECLPALQAEETLLAIMVSDHPHATEADRNKIHRILQRDADTEVEVPSIDPSTEAGQFALAGMGIAVDFSEVNTEPHA